MSATRVKGSCFGFNSTVDRIADIHYPLLQQQQESKNWFFVDFDVPFNKSLPSKC